MDKGGDYVRFQLRRKQLIINFQMRRLFFYPRGLLGGHVSAVSVKTTSSTRMFWYKRQLLDMAIDLANRLLPAFNTSTGLPYPRVNLNRGIGGHSRTEVCTFV